MLQYFTKNMCDSSSEASIFIPNSQLPDSPASKPNTATQHKGKGILNKGVWDKKEHFKYYLYAYHHLKHLQDDETRRLLQLFKGMAFFVGTRTSSQCRAHHQKIIKKFKGLRNAVNFYISKHRNFMEIYGRIRHQLSDQADYNFCCDFNFKGQLSGSIDEVIMENCQSSSPIMEQSAVSSISLSQVSPRVPEKVHQSDLAISGENMMGEWVICHYYFIQWIRQLQMLLQICPGR